MLPEPALSRRGFLAGALALAGGAKLIPEARAAPTLVALHRFVSRPDLRPPVVAVSTASETASAGHIFVAPFQITGKAGPNYGALILDGLGQPIWFKPESTKTAMNLRVQKYKGEPVITWYEGDVLGGYGGDFIVADQSYREFARVKAGHGEHGDLHEFLLTSRGTALITIYSNIPFDLTPVGGSANGQLTEGVIQEIDVPTGKVLTEWRSSAHVGLDESLLPSVKNDVADYFHLNSVGVDIDGHLLVSARHTWTVYKVHRQTGAILWRLGGKHSDFTIVPGAEFSFQHDVRRHADGTLTIFDNNAAAPTATTNARPIRLALDMSAKTARLVAEYQPDRPRVAWAMGNLEQLPDGGAFVGWGTAGAFTEFAPDGTVRFDATLADGSVTYRAFRAPWVGRPAESPRVAITRDAGGAFAHVSWNGATEVAKWRADVGSRRTALHPVATARRTGFETILRLGNRKGYVALTALDAAGKVLGTSSVHRLV
ncbi:MAG TPA: arylsulfotransferase family protein [Gaiellaceae bacterium]|nr:arylsulfotransferase family protein [Gaiellaceae bacterium]